MTKFSDALSRMKVRFVILERLLTPVSEQEERNIIPGGDDGGLRRYSDFISQL